MLVLAGLLVIGSLFGVVICHAMLVTGQGRLDDLEQQVSQEQTRYQALRLEVAELESPGRIVEAAHALGMVSPEEITYLTPVATSAAGAGAGGEVRAASAGAAPWAAVKPLLGGRG
jgi:cell division protein FtsL